MRKTIVLVTHDIDEAVALGDRVAVLNVGGVLEQYAAPDELLAAPANEFVASFLGAERSIKRLALSTVGSLDLEGGPWIDVAAPARRRPRRCWPATGSELARASSPTGASPAGSPRAEVGRRRALGDLAPVPPAAAGAGPTARCARRSR